MSESSSILDELQSKRQVDDKQKKIDMGSPWAEEELEIFLQYFRESGLKNLEVMQSRLQDAGYSRTISNLISVYMKNKNFLKINSNCTAKEFSAIMADHYESLEHEYQSDIRGDNAMEIETAENFDSRRKPNSRIFRTSESKMQRMEEGSASKRRSAKAKRTVGSRHYDQDDNNYDNLSRLRRGTARYDGGLVKEKIKKPRKSPLVTSKNVPDMELDDPNLLKKVEGQLCASTLKRNRKHLASNSKKTTDDQPSQSFVRYVICECYYSTIDSPYFEFNEFKAILGANSETTSLKFKRAEWAKIRSLMGRPRRFSDAFVGRQLDELNKYRDNVRNYLNKKISLNNLDLHPELIDKIRLIQPLRVGQPVFALLPAFDLFHCGSILTTSDNKAIVKFPNELGAMNIPDVRIIVLPSEDGSEIGTPDRDANASVDLETRTTRHQNLLQEIDFYAMALFIKILERKTTLLNEMKNFNDLAEENPSNLNERFYQEYGWTGVQINLLDNALKHISAKWRLRGLHNFNVNQIMENFDRIIANPIKNFIEIEQHKAETEQEIDEKFIKEIKSALNQNIELKIDEKLRDMNRKYAEHKQDRIMKQESEPVEMKFENPVKLENGADGGREVETTNNTTITNLIEDDSSQEKSDSLKKMVESIVGLLLSLKQSGELSITDNRYLTELCDNIYSDNPDKFHEINNLLLNICSK